MDTTSSRRPLVIAHLGDTHLRDAQFSRPARGQDFFRAAIAQIEAGLSANVDLFVNTGDFMNVSRPSATVIGQIMAIDGMLRSAGKFMLCISGNHDYAAPTTWLQTLFMSDEDYRVGNLTAQDAINDGTGGILPIDGDDVEFEGWKFYGMPVSTLNAYVNRKAEWDAPAAKSQADVILMHLPVHDICSNIHMPENAALPLHQLPHYPGLKGILLGDLHQQAHIRTPQGVYIAYPGSAELCDRGEEPLKSVPIVELSDEAGVVYLHSVAYDIRPLVNAVVETPEDLDALMVRLQPLAEAHPMVSVEFNRDVPGVASRVFGLLDAEKAVIRLHPLPADKTLRLETKSETGRSLLSFFQDRFKEQPEPLRELVENLVGRGLESATSTLSDYITARKATLTPRE